MGDQEHLDRDDMLVLNSALAEVLVIIAHTFPEAARVDVVSLLLDEARHILSCQATARGTSIEWLIERYFTALSVQEARRSLS